MSHLYEPNKCVACGKRGVGIGLACPEHHVQVNRFFEWQRQESRASKPSILDLLNPENQR